MRHLVKKKKLNMPASHRKSLIRNLASQVIQYESVKTTKSRAVVVSAFVDKLINIGKKNDLNARRTLYSHLYSELVVLKIMEVLSQKFKDRNSGYTSIVKIGKRSGDNSLMVKITLN